MKAKDASDLTGLVVGEFTLLQQVGKGGMGAVYKARTRDGRIVAIKLLASDLVGNETQLKRFYQEAQIAMRLDHPNVVKALEVGEDSGRHFFAMEFVDGENLGQLLKRNGRFPENEAVAIVVAVAQALHKAHKMGLVHRDVKPDNVMVTRDRQVKLADMGLAKQVDSDMNLTKTGRGLGTPHFMAPEQFKNAKFADPRCDVYSLGATLYVMVTGEVPFRGSGPLDAFLKKSSNEFTPPEEIVEGLSTRVIRAIKMAMDADPNNRPQGAKAFAEILLGKNVTPQSANEFKLPTDEDLTVWFVLYRDETGERRKLMGKQAAIEREIREGRITSDAMASRDKKGPYARLGTIRTFKMALSEAASAQTANDLGIETPRGADLPPTEDYVPTAPSLLVKPGADPKKYKPFGKPAVAKLDAKMVIGAIATAAVVLLLIWFFFLRH